MSIDWLGTLEKLRLDSPEEAAERAHASIERLRDDPVEYARLCGIYGSAMRAMSRLPEAYEAIREGLRFADQAGDLTERAELLRRYGFVFAEEAKFEAAFQCANEALSIFTVFGRSDGIGKTLVDKAGWHYHLQQYDLAIRSNEQGLAALPKSEENHRLAALLGLAYCSRAIGDLEQSRRLAAQALRKQELPAKSLRFSFLWLEGEIATEERDLDRACEVFASLVTSYRESKMFLDAATAAVELVRVLLQAGRGLEASRTAGSLIWLIAPLKSNRLAYAAILELVRSGQGGLGLTQAQIHTWQGELRAARSGKSKRKAAEKP